MLRAFSRPVQYDFDIYFQEFYEQVARKVARALRWDRPALILQCEPAPGIEAAAASLPSLLHHETAVVSLQNGIDKDRTIGGIVGHDRILGAVTYVLVDRPEPGVVVHNGRIQRIVVGEPGVGKSRLYWEFTHSHRTHGWLILEGGAVSYGKFTSYLPVVDVLRVLGRARPKVLGVVPVELRSVDLEATLQDADAVRQERELRCWHVAGFRGLRDERQATAHQRRVADGVLEHYAAAYGNATDEGRGHGHDDEDSMADGGMDMTETSSTEGNMSDGMEMDEGMTMSEGNETIVSMVHYQSAQGMVVGMQQLFSDQVKELAPANSTEAMAKFEGSLIHLKQAIDDRESFAHVEVLVHSEVHPSLQSAFNLQVIPEFPMPMLLVIPAIAGIVAATRLSALRRK